MPASAIDSSRTVWRTPRRSAAGVYYRSVAGASVFHRRTRRAARGRAGCSGRSACCWSVCLGAVAAAPARGAVPAGCRRSVEVLLGTLRCVGQPLRTFTALHRQPQAVSFAWLARPTTTSLHSQWSPRRPGGAGRLRATPRTRSAGNSHAHFHRAPRAQASQRRHSSVVIDTARARRR